MPCSMAQRATTSLIAAGLAAFHACRLVVLGHLMAASRLLQSWGPAQTVPLDASEHNPAPASAPGCRLPRYLRISISNVFQVSTAAQLHCKPFTENMNLTTQMLDRIAVMGTHCNDTCSCRLAWCSAVAC